MKPAVLILAMLLASMPVCANTRAAQPLAAAERHEVIVELGKQLRANYIFPEVADRVAANLLKKERGGGYTTTADPVSFTKMLTDDLQTQGKDLHLNVMFAPEFRKPASPAQMQDTTPDLAEVEFAARRGFGVESVQRLPGNVGLLEVRGFGPTEVVASALSAAMLLVSGTDALILDLRRNQGGDPKSVAHLLSHFFALGDDRHLNSIYSRADKKTRQFWTSNAVMPRYTRPVYVLTSKQTFSGGEECAYDLQTQKRATLVGETTGGGANPGDVFALAHGYVAFIPNQQSINPVTHTSWEHTGVKPDIAVDAADAQRVAYAMILRALVDKAANPEAKAQLQALLADLDAKAVEGQKQ